MTAVSLPEALRERMERGLRLRRGVPRGRFAPSPSGPLHWGNLRTALLSWLDARRAGGIWLLRLDDLDRPRVRKGAEEAILHDLRWLGLHWDGPVVRQSQRIGLYASVLSALRRGGALYPCHCSRRLLADISAPHGGLSVYPGHCRLAAPVWGERNGRLPSWRLRLHSGPIHWLERWGAPGRLDGPTLVGDVVLRRADGVVAYHLATAVDELTLGISDVVRGADLWCSTGAQVAVCEALGFAPPRYGHVPLLCDREGRRLSKRAASEGLDALREHGYDPPAAIGALAASAGLASPGARFSLSELLAELKAKPERLDQALIRAATGGSSLQTFRFSAPTTGDLGRQSV